MCASVFRVDTVCTREQNLPSQQFCHDAPNGPNIHLHSIVHPVEHYLRSPPVSCGDVPSHLLISSSGQTKVKDLQTPDNVLTQRGV